MLMVWPGKGVGRGGRLLQAGGHYCRNNLNIIDILYYIINRLTYFECC